MTHDPSAAAPQRSILIVEDDPITRSIVTRYFELAGLIVHTAESGEDALAVLRAHGRAIDWLFTDICLSGEISGWIVGAEFNLNHPLRPVIYATASAQQALAQAAGSVFIQKPYSPQDVFRVFRDLESRAEAMSAMFRSAWDERPGAPERRHAV